MFNLTRPINMLAIGNKFKKDPAAVLLARDARTNKSIFYVPIGPYPTQRIRGNPLDLVDGDELLRIFKKYGLKKKTIAKLINFYEDSEEESLELDDDFKLKLCFEKLESLMLDALKNIYVDPLSEIEVAHNPDLLLSVAMIGQSNSGKTFQMTEILLRPEFLKIKTYVFTQNPSDTSILRLKQRGKYTIFVDLDKINSPLKLTRDVSPGSILVFDDCFEIQRGDNENGHDLRKNLINLMNQTMVRGRHHKNKKGRGTSCIICAHNFRNGFDSKTLWTELQGGLYIYPSSSPHKTHNFLHKTIGIAKQDLKQIFKFSKNSRWICFKISGKPLYASWDHGVYLL